RSPGCVYRVLPRRPESQDSSCRHLRNSGLYQRLWSPLDQTGGKPFDEKNLTGLRLLNQLQILESIQSRIDSVITDVQGALLAELEDRELDAAQKLKDISLRAAGTLAGVVVERHLQRLAQAHGVVAKKNPTIADLNDLLKQHSIYGVAVWRKIQYLADIRNLCVHKKNEEATEEQLSELIDGVNGIVKTVH